ncbi:hypothetical protein BN159_7228 [Streptomyces davaonensis JCM 4913]|uniref:Uncharacterized protein n=1 Tax=Streptomyces davaonensis (strain DSM 101723 / JCM 4913 / KCC S-0913 / 768) TaxID=1214101 RepID=K4RDN7_STRDJ|nr:hypothetical protein BN159_7228 [Streptomyces davaonensis JCM 4913]
MFRSVHLLECRRGRGLARIDPMAGEVLDGPMPVWSGSGMADPEGPHLYRIGEWR